MKNIVAARNGMWNKNELCEVTITDLGAEGEGIGKVDGFPLFIKDALPGDVIEAKILKAKKNYAFARVERVITPSPYRITPACPYARACGGCQIQALAYEKQLEFKQDKVRNHLVRIGGVDAEHLDTIMEPIIGMDVEEGSIPMRYRNKAQFPVGRDKSGKTICGFYAGRTHDIIANTDCILGVTENELVLKTVLAYMEKHQVEAYDEKTGKGLVRHVLIRKGFVSQQLMVCLVINGKTLPKADILADELWNIPGMHSFSISVNEENTNVILGRTYQTLRGEDTIKDTIYQSDYDAAKGVWTRREDSGVEYHVSPLSFYQVNPGQTQRLYSTALAYAGLTGRETVWDIYCGIGTISLFLAKSAAQVRGVEIVPQAIEDARANAANNRITNVEFYVGKAEEVLPEYYEKENAAGRKAHADVIVVDPPRKGCDEVCLNTMVQMQPDRIVYVSCDSATLARDVKYLQEQGYELKKVRACDMFGNTMHVETVVLLSQRKADNHIEVDLDLDGLDVTSAESKATYNEIQQYVLKETGLMVSNLYIAQIKKKCGIDVGVGFNKPKTENAKQPKCPEDKEKAIKDALKHFGMI